MKIVKLNQIVWSEIASRNHFLCQESVDSKLYNKPQGEVLRDVSDFATYNSSSCAVTNLLCQHIIVHKLHSKRQNFLAILKS